MDNYAERIRPLIKSSGLTIKEISRKTGIPEKTLYNWESGIKSYNKFYMQLADFFNVSVEYLTGESDSPTPVQAESIPHEKLREVFAEGGVHVLLDADNKMPANHLMDIIDYIKAKQQENDRS